MDLVTKKDVRHDVRDTVSGLRYHDPARTSDIILLISEFSAPGTFRVPVFMGASGDPPGVAALPGAMVSALPPDDVAVTLIFSSIPFNMFECVHN